MFQSYLQYYLKKTVWIAVNCILVLIFVRFFIGEAGRVSGASMEPVLYDGQLFWVNKIVYLIHPPRRFDIVQLFNPTKTEELLVKRIVGMPGDTLTLTSNQLLIATADQEEFQLTLPEQSDVPSSPFTQVITLPAYSYFVLGDHYSTSADSRVFGVVHRRWINGKVLSLDL